MTDALQFSTLKTLTPTTGAGTLAGGLLALSAFDRLGFLAA